MNAIEIHDLSKAYTGFSLNNISFSLPQGGILGLVGENGAGKSTTIKLLMNAIQADSGSVSVLGTDVQSPAFNVVKEDIGVVLDEAYYPESLTPSRVSKVMKHTYKRWDDALFNNLLRKLALPQGKPFKDFSRGMKMKLAIAVALSHDPKLLILDEATSGLDPMVRDEILDIFNDFTRDETHSILLSSHIVSDLEKICDYIAFLHNGTLLLCEEKDRLLDEYAIVRIPKADLAALPPQTVLGMKKGEYSIEALVRRGTLSGAFQQDRPTLEEIILLLAKGGIAR